MENTNNVVVIGISKTKNFHHTMLRSERFSTIIEINLPTQNDRLEMIEVFNDNCGAQLTFDTSINLETVAMVLYGFTPADMKQLVEEANRNAIIDQSPIIKKDHLNQAAFAVFRSKGFVDQEYTLRLKIAVDLLEKNLTEKKGFNRIIGDVPQEILDLVDELKDDLSYKLFNIDVPKGILMVGPPGTGKTTLARAVSEEAECVFMPISAAEFSQSYVGAGAQVVRDLFAEARLKAKDSPCGKTIIFIDEIDAIGARQGNALDSTITQLLTEMDGFDEDSPIVVIAASNHPENLDKALLRPGRFDKMIKVGLPNLDTRKIMLTKFLQNIPVAVDVDIEKIAQVTNNFSPAELKEMIKKAASIARTSTSQQIEQHHIITAMKKSLGEKIIKGDKNAQQQIDNIDVVFFGKASQKGFARIAGGVPQEVKDLVGMITEPEKYEKFGIKRPSGILFTGPPGTGKTLLAKAIAEEVGCEFMEAKGSDFINQYVGLGANNIRKLFAEARTKAENNQFGITIIFIDELDALGSRSGWNVGQETKRTITELITQMDGFSKDNSVIVIAATNDPDSIDDALKRNGRLDEIVEIGLPYKSKRKALLEMYCKKCPVADSVSLDQIADDTDGFNAADISEVVTKAAKNAMRNGKNAIEQDDFDQAVQKIIDANDMKDNSFI